jgi:glucose uptake protein GlcU
MDIGWLELIPIILLVIGIIYLSTKDANKRGFNELQVLALRVILLFTSPVGIILYFILRPRYRMSVSN